MNRYLDYKQPLLARVYLDDHLITAQRHTDSLNRQLSLTAIIDQVNTDFGTDSWNRIEFVKEAAETVA
jgi:hypothetical protein